MDANATLEANLRALERKWEQITDVPESPRSLMDVIEYSLSSPGSYYLYLHQHDQSTANEPHFTN